MASLWLLRLVLSDLRSLRHSLVRSGTAEPGELLRTSGLTPRPRKRSGIFGFAISAASASSLAFWLSYLWSLVAWRASRCGRRLNVDTGKAIITVVIGWVVVFLIGLVVAGILGAGALGLGVLSGSLQ
ncbi:MAG: hypothetical protein V9H69_04640 [Anaerolineae bacterium]